MMSSASNINCLGFEIPKRTEAGGRGGGPPARRADTIPEEQGISLQRLLVQDGSRPSPDHRGVGFPKVTRDLLSCRPLPGHLHEATRTASFAENRGAHTL